MKHRLIDLFDELTPIEKIRKVLHGLHSPKSSGDYKYAQFQLLRLWSPASAVIVPVLILLIILMLPVSRPHHDDSFTVTIEPEPPRKEIELEPPVEPPVIKSIITPPDVALPDVEDSTGGESGVLDEPFSFKPATQNATPFYKSPVVFVNLPRGPSAIIGGPDGRGPGPATEGAVIRALRWLKEVQEDDGAWRLESGGGPGKGAAPAMTGLALLTYMARGVTPADPEFGYTVQHGLEWLIAHQDADGRFRERDKHDYSHPIATYALCEAYLMIKSPALQNAAEKAVAVLLLGQTASGGWDYNCKQSNRNDTSYMGWCAQALKAAQLAQLDNEGIDSAVKHAINGFKRNAAEQGGFGYTSPSASHLTGVGVLCLQLLGAADDPAAKRGLQWLERASLDWDEPWGKSPLYYWYYVTQAKFQAGKDVWDPWDRQMRLQIPSSQTVLEKAGEDGKDIGYWTACSEREHCKSYVYNTALCTLMLEVYYKFLCTFNVSEANPIAEGHNPDREVKVILL